MASLAIVLCNDHCQLLQHIRYTDMLELILYEKRCISSGFSILKGGDTHRGSGI
jgi:hypothetical protein